jgi:hypothetical protein
MDLGFLTSTGDSPPAQVWEAFIGIQQRGWFAGIGVVISGVASRTG